MEVNYCDISSGKNKLASEMYQVFEKYERNKNDKRKTGAFGTLETNHKRPRICNKSKVEGLLHSTEGVFISCDQRVEKALDTADHLIKK